jgi:hypothetical protein
VITAEPADAAGWQVEVRPGRMGLPHPQAVAINRHADAISALDVGPVTVDDPPGLMKLHPPRQYGIVPQACRPAP